VRKPILLWILGNHHQQSDQMLSADNVISFYQVWQIPYCHAVHITYTWSATFLFTAAHVESHFQCRNRKRLHQQYVITVTTHFKHIWVKHKIPPTLFSKRSTQLCFHITVLCYSDLPMHNPSLSWCGNTGIEKLKAEFFHQPKIWQKGDWCCNFTGST